LGDNDRIIRDLDIPERIAVPIIQLGDADLVKKLLSPWEDEVEIKQAVDWISSRISSRVTEAYILKDRNGDDQRGKDEFLKCLTDVVKYYGIDFYEPPFIWEHRKDQLIMTSHYENRKHQLILLNKDELWKVQTLLHKWRLLKDKMDNLWNLYQKLIKSFPLDDSESNIQRRQKDWDYFEYVWRGLSSGEEVLDLSDWLALKYPQQLEEIREKLKEEKNIEDGGDGGRILKFKKPVREGKYERAKRTVISRMVEVRNHCIPTWLKADLDVWI
jgi:hypothetical protein